MAFLTQEQREAEHRRLVKLDETLVELEVSPRMLLPHKMSYSKFGSHLQEHFEFTPRCLVPAGWAENLVKQYPDTFSFPKEGSKPDKSKYKWNQKEITKRFDEEFSKYTPAEKQQAIEYMRSLKAPATMKADDGGGPEPDPNAFQGKGKGKGKDKGDEQ